MKRLAWYTFIALATLSVVFLIWQFRLAIILFVLSLAMAAMLRPLINFLVARKFPRALALALTYFAVVAVIAGLSLVLGGPIIAETQSMATDLPSRYQQLKIDWLAGTWFQQAIAQNLPDMKVLLRMFTGLPTDDVLQGFLGIMQGSLDVISNVMIIFVLSIYWSADQEGFVRLWLSLLPARMRSPWRNIWRKVENDIGEYLRSELIQSLLTVILLGVIYHLIGLRYPVLLAILAAVAWLLVWYGGLAAIIPALLFGLAISPALGLLAAVLTIAVLSVLKFAVEPRLINRHHVSSLLKVIMVVILVKEFGIIGLLIAPPVAAIIQILASHLFQPTTTNMADVLPPKTVQLQILGQRLNLVQTKITEQSEPPNPVIDNLVERLDKLINRAYQEEISETK